MLMTRLLMRPAHAKPATKTHQPVPGYSPLALGPRSPLKSYILRKWPQVIRYVSTAAHDKTQAGNCLMGDRTDLGRGWGLHSRAPPRIPYPVR
jgi:hypothetical protein